MKKKAPLIKTKKDFEIVYKNPLQWCPLFGFVPDTFDIKLQKWPLTIDPQGNGDTLSSYDLALELRDYIKEAREYWCILPEYFNLLKYDHLPDVKTLPIKLNNEGLDYRYITYEKKCTAARYLFRCLLKLAWGEGFIFDKIMEQRTPFISTWRWENYESNILYDTSAEGLLNHAQMIMDDSGNAVGFDYPLAAYEVYSLLAIYEAWLLLIELMNNKYKPEHEDVILGRTSYIRTLLCAAEEQREKILLKGELYENKEKKKAKGERAKKASKQRVSIKEVFQKAIDKLKEKNPRKNVDDLYKFIFKNHCVDEDSILRFCGNDTNVVNKFHKIEVGMDEYYLYCMPDIVVPDDPFKACLFLIKNKDYETKCKPRTFDTYRSEYFYKRKLKGDKAK